MELKTLNFTVESLNKPYKYSWQAFKDDRASGAFEIEGGWVDLSILVSYTLSFDHIASITFSRNTEDDMDNYAITGDGDAFRIFATVLTMVDEWIKKYGEQVDVIEFTAEKKNDPKGSRAKLYDRMVKKYIPKGWKYEKSDGTGRNVRFKLVNLDPKKPKSVYKI